jgi:hypothetical protein
MEVLRRTLEFTLHAPITVVYQFITFGPGIQGLFEGIKGQIAA